MSYNDKLFTKLTNMHDVDSKPVIITEKMSQARDKIGKHAWYEALGIFDETIRHSLNIDVEADIKLLDALANKRQDYISVTFNMDEFAGSNHLIKDQGEPNGILSYIATADFYITRPTLYNFTEFSVNGGRHVDEWKFDPKYITVGGEYYLPYIVKVFTNLHNGVTKACLYRINTKTLNAEVQYCLYNEYYTFSTNIVLGFVNIKQDNEEDYYGEIFAEQFKPTSDSFNRLKIAVVDGIKTQLVQDVDTPLDKRIIQVSDDTLVDANYVCPLTVSSENLDRIIGTIVRVRNGVSFKKDKPVDIYKGDKLIGASLSGYECLSYAWYLTYHYIPSNDVPLRFNAKYKGNNSSYYKQWNVDGEIIMKVDMTDSRQKYQNKYDVILKDKYSGIKFENIGGYISWYKDESNNAYNQTDIFIDTRSIVSMCDKSCYKSLFTSETGLENFFKFYYSTLTNNVRFSHNMFMTLIALDQEYEQPGFDQLIKFFEQTDSMKMKLLNVMIFNTKAIDLMIWLELIKKEVEPEAIELATADPAYEDLSEAFVENIKNNDYKSATKSFYGLLNLITDNVVDVPKDLCEEPTFDDQFLRRFLFDNKFRIMFNVLFENVPTFGNALQSQKSIQLAETYKELKLTLEETHDFQSMMECLINKSKITDAFDVLDCLKDLSLNQKQFIYRVLCDYY